MELSQVSKSEAARYMGVRGEPDERITAILDNCEPIVRKRLRPAYVYREVEVTFADDGVHLSGVNVPLTGKDIRSLCSEIALFNNQTRIISAKKTPPTLPIKRERVGGATVFYTILCVGFGLPG